MKVNGQKLNGYYYFDRRPIPSGPITSTTDDNMRQLL